MDATRRGFLKLMGLGTATVAVGPSLFSADAVAMVGEADHLVFDGAQAILTEDAKAEILYLADDIWAQEHGHCVARLLMRRSGVMRSKRGSGWTPVGDASTYQADCPIGPGKDPYIEFFLAANRLRDKINTDVREFLKHLRLFNKVMITMVDVPIMAIPKSDSGFYLEAQIHQFAAHKNDIRNADKAVSSRGEIPIECPNDIDFKYLMLMQQELQAMGMLNWNRESLAEASKRSGQAQWRARDPAISLSYKR